MINRHCGSEKISSSFPHPIPTNQWCQSISSNQKLISKYCENLMTFSLSLSTCLPTPLRTCHHHHHRRTNRSKATNHIGHCVCSRSDGTTLCMDWIQWDIIWWTCFSTSSSRSCIFGEKASSMDNEKMTIGRLKVAALKCQKRCGNLLWNKFSLRCRTFDSAFFCFLILWVKCWEN